MEQQVILTLAILSAAILLFVTEWLRIDLIALLVLSALALVGLVTPEEALSGFSNPAVVTMWAIFIISGGLSKVGVASKIGNLLLRFSGSGEMRLIVLIMLTSGLLSSFMNNIGVAALLLPVVMDVARSTRRRPSKLLLPLAYGSLLGGMITQIGTPPNILISNALVENDLRPFGMFDYSPMGLIVLLVGILFMALIGRHLLPERESNSGIAVTSSELVSMYDLQARMYRLRLPNNSTLDGHRLDESRLGSILGINIAAIVRDGEPNLAPRPADILKSNDQLLVTGKLDQLADMQNHPMLKLEEKHLAMDEVASDEFIFAEIEVTEQFPHLGQNVLQTNFRSHYKAVVLAIFRQGQPYHGAADSLPLEAGDVLLIQGYRVDLDGLKDNAAFRLSELQETRREWLNKHLMTLNIPEESSLVGKSLAESHLSGAFGLGVLGIVREDETYLMPTAEVRLQANDRIYVRGESGNLLALDDLQDIRVAADGELDLTLLESDQVGVVEAMLSPHTRLEGKTLNQLHFREKYGLNVLAIWRGGKPYRLDLRDRKLRLGDALLLHGPRRKLKMLATDPDFLVLAEEIQEEPRLKKIPLALLIMVGVLVPVILGWLPIYISAIAGAALMILTGCLNMDEAYRFIDWRAVFLMAGMLPLGIAMEKTGTAQFLAGGVIALVGDLGPRAVVAAVFLLTSLASQVMPNAATAVLLFPIALSTASNLNISPYPLMMTVAVSASAAFLSPVAHAANVLIMGPGGYRFRDYLRVGIPLTLVVMAVVLLILPFFWPL
jgi:di/tricarboxylate transporter